MKRGIAYAVLVPALVGVVGCESGPTPAAPSESNFRGVAARSTETIFSPLNLPEPNDVRSASGKPGPAYWQQRADYVIDATLDEKGERVTAKATVTYVNNSPEPLPYVWVHLEQNAFRPDSTATLMREQEGRFGNRHPFEGGFDVNAVRVNGAAARIETYDAIGRIDLPAPIAAKGGTAKFEFEWTFKVTPYGADRSGIYPTSDGPIFQIAQWFPAIAKFDDVHGWNALPYLGQGEFYTDFGTFDVRITVPRTHLVFASGVLQNESEVLTQTQVDRLTQARRSEKPAVIRGEGEVKDPASRPGGEGPLTWVFRGEDVRTFAWSSSSAFLWDAAGIDWGNGTGTVCQSVYSRDALPLWAEKATDSLRDSILQYSSKWHRYPYPVATNVNGIVGGMEYPMIIYCAERKDERGLYGVTTHEIGHNWFPMLVSNDERRHAWMDEGFNTFINYYAFKNRFPDSKPSRGDARQFAPSMLEPHQQPVETPADQILAGRLGQLEYAKTATGLVILREAVLGPARFDKAFKEYVDAWAFKSPRPWDFFRCMENGAGADLTWFWRGWFYETGTFDMAVESVTQPGPGAKAVVGFRNRGELVFPAVYRVTYTDGTKEDRRLPVECWYTTNRFAAAWDSGGRKISSVEIDPEELLPDVNPANNTWGR